MQTLLEDRKRQNASQLILRGKYNLDIEIRCDKEKLETNLTNKSRLNSPKFEKNQVESRYI